MSTDEEDGDLAQDRAWRDHKRKVRDARDEGAALELHDEFCTDPGNRECPVFFEYIALAQRVLRAGHVAEIEAELR